MPFPELYQIYVLCLVTIFLLILANSVFPYTRVTTWAVTGRNFLRHNVVKRHSLVGPWSLRSVLLHFSYIGVNLVCLCSVWQRKNSSTKLVAVSSLDEAASQAAYLAIANLLPLFIAPSLFAMADLVNTSARSFTGVHRAAGTMSICLCVFHATVKFAAKPSIRLIGSADIDKIMIMVSIVFFLIASVVKKLSYEVFFRAHLCSALLLVVGVAWHLLSISHLSRLPFYIYLTMTCTLNLFIFSRMIYRNKTLGSSWPRAFLSRVSSLDGVVHMRLRTSRQLRVRPGQYLNIWLPRVQLWSMHPFTIATSTWHPNTGQMELDFFIQARKGFTMKLLQSCHESATVERLVFFSGPHGTPIRHTSANTVIMVTTGMGVWPMFSYIEDMIRTNRSRSATSRIVLVYITKKLSIVVRDAVNLQLLKGDGRIRVFICDESEHRPSQLGRATILPHVPDLQQLIEQPVDFENEVRFQLLEQSCVMSDNDQNEHGGQTLLLVSAENAVRDEIVHIVSRSRKRLDLHELDYVPLNEPVSTEIPLHGTSEIKITRRSVDRGSSSRDTVIGKLG